MHSSLYIPSTCSPSLFFYLPLLLSPSPSLSLSLAFPNKKTLSLTRRSPCISDPAACSQCPRYRSRPAAARP
ncbi:unnamed protein product [Chondrus crispus]|uniref:Uncharacterized protein n=1 Tax=Chondrus crispus TaxID=2769 RepID=R7QEU9_CHOCR|nr:unnamed protein product [Chondrus crispus]CDF37022.1 unnamed protein product [Chondrus crispus]|eukprot:XP_005716841.1 unnamed protein product [Chondrus crispus]